MTVLAWPFRRVSPTTKFWKWFQANRERLHLLSAERDDLIEEVHSRLSRIHPGLVFELGMESGRAVEFVVSADGNASLFGIVMDTITAAPEIPGWKLTAFRQPGTTDVSISMRGHDLRASEIWFSTEPDGQKTGVVLFLPGLAEDNHEALSHASLILLDNALGEFLVETQIGFVDFQPLPEAPESCGLLAFTSIANHVQQRIQ